MKKISLNCSDAELSAAVAEHVAGIKPVYKEGWGEPWNYQDGFYDWPTGRTVIWRPIPKFATDANAVLPLLEKAQGGFTTDFNKSEWQVNLCVHGPSSDWYDGYGPTFARAACFALLRANGITLADGASERGTSA